MIFWILFLLLILLGIWFCIEQHVLRVRKQTLSLEHLPAALPSTRASRVSLS